MASLPFVRDGLLKYEQIPLHQFSALGFGGVAAEPGRARSFERR
jgi:hypothetical protein